MCRTRIAPLVLLGAVLGVGCPPNVAIRPDGNPAEEKCPEGAQETMTALGLIPNTDRRRGSHVSIFLNTAQKTIEPLILYDGPIESETWTNIEDLPGGTRLQGRVWTSGPRVVIRYYSARLPDGKVIPFCAVAGENGPSIRRHPVVLASPPSKAHLHGCTSSRSSNDPSHSSVASRVSTDLRD